MSKKISPPATLNISPPAKKNPIGRNVASSLARVKRVLNAGGTGTIKS